MCCLTVVNIINDNIIWEVCTITAHPFKHVTWQKTIDIHRDPRPPIPPRVMASSAMGLTQIGGLWVFAEHRPKNKHKTNAPTIFVHLAAFYACLSVCSHARNQDVGRIKSTRECLGSSHAWPLTYCTYSQILYFYDKWFNWYYSNADICTWQTRVILITRKPEDPQFEPHAGIKMAQVLESPV